ncbi:hypothetical protein RQP46_005014 [Phenoliferia psychrophenolica]
MSSFPESHQFVFKIKRDWHNERAETRRYGFSGNLRQQQVFDGLYDRTSQVFDLPRDAFYLAFAGDGTRVGGAEARLDGYHDFLQYVCQDVLSPEGLAEAQRDQKGRLVLVFHVRHPQQEEPEPAPAPAQVPTYSQWDEDTALALAQSSDLDLEHRKRTAEHSALDAAEMGRAPAVLQEATPPLEWAPIPATSPRPVTPPSKSTTLPASSPYHWTWAGPSFPPAPPTVPLSRLPHRATQPVIPAQSSPGYTPAYTVPPPIVSTEQPEEESSAPSPPVVEAWSGALLRTFVHDLNQHLAANFDEAAGFELSLPESEVRSNVRNGRSEDLKEEIHPSVFCDHCLKTIVGTRYKCTDAACPNWDCCQSCVGDFATFHDATHELGAIAKPGATLVKQARETHDATVAPAASLEAQAPLVEHPATCNGCDETIKGVRHKCKSRSLHHGLSTPNLEGDFTGLNCPDHDLCASCFTQVDSIHPLHNFLPITDPSAVRMKVQPGERVVHRNIICDGCEASPIVGVRYLCTHASCEGQFDLCSSCEADPVPRHPRSHHLLKLREPVSQSSVAPAVHLARAKTTEPENTSLDVLLRSLGIAPQGQSHSSGAFPTNAQLVDGPGNDRTLVIDLDLDPITTGLPALIHVPIAIPAGGAPEAVVTSPIVAEPLIDEADDNEKTDEKAAESEEVNEKTEEINVEATPPAMVECPAYGATFVNDVTLMDRSSVAPGALFTKIWQVKNTGTDAWPVGTHLVHVGGFSTSTEDLATKEVPLALAGEVVEISCDLKAPEEDGRKMFLFRLADANGEVFGDRIWVDITVEYDEVSSLASSIVVPSPNDAPASTASAATHPSADALSVDESEDEDEDSSIEDDESIEDSDSDSDSESDAFVHVTGSERDSEEEASDAEWDNTQA